MIPSHFHFTILDPVVTYISDSCLRVESNELDTLWWSKVTSLCLDDQHICKLSNLDKLENLKVWAQTVDTHTGTPADRQTDRQTDTDRHTDQLTSEWSWMVGRTDSHTGT